MEVATKVPGKVFYLHNMWKLCRQYGDSMESNTFYGDFIYGEINI